MASREPGGSSLPGRGIVLGGGADCVLFPGFVICASLMHFVCTTTAFVCCVLLHEGILKRTRFN